MPVTNQEWMLGVTFGAIRDELTDVYYGEAADVFEILAKNPDTGYLTDEIANQVLGDVLLETGHIGPDGETHRESQYDELQEFQMTIDRLLQEFVDEGFVTTRDVKTRDGVATYYRFHPAGWDGIPTPDQ